MRLHMRLLGDRSLGASQRPDEPERLVNRILLRMRIAVELARVARAQDAPIGVCVVHVLRGPRPGKSVCGRGRGREERVERACGHGEDAADAEGGRLGLALEGLGEGEEEVVRVDIVWSSSVGASVDQFG